MTALLAMQTETKKNAFIVPRGLAAMMGLPKIKKFPKKRERPNLYEMLNNI